VVFIKLSIISRKDHVDRSITPPLLHCAGICQQVVNKCIIVAFRAAADHAAFFIFYCTAVGYLSLNLQTYRPGVFNRPKDLGKKLKPPNGGTQKR